MRATLVRWAAALGSGSFLNRWSALVSLLVALTLMLPHLGEAEPAELPRLIWVSAISWGILAFALVPVALAERRWRDPVARAGLLVITLTGAAAVRPLLSDAVNAWLSQNPWNGETPALHRVLTNVLVWWVVLSATSMMHEFLVRHHAVVARLRLLDASASRDTLLIADRLRVARAMTEQFPRELCTLLQAPTLTDARLAATVGERVRTWSQGCAEFADRAPTGEDVDTDARATSIRARRRLAVQALRLPPVGVVTGLTMLLVLPYGLVALPPDVLVFHLAGFLLLGWCADVLPRWWLARRGSTAQALGWCILCAVIGVAATIAGERAGLPAALFWFPAVILPSTALVTSALSAQWHALQVERRALATRIADRRSALRTEDRRTQHALRTAAQLLHRDGQSACVLFQAGVLSGAEFRAQLCTVVTELGWVWEPEPTTVDPAAGLFAALRDWTAVCEVTRAIEPAVLEAIAASPELATDVREVLVEGLVNTVKHAPELRAEIRLWQQLTGAGPVVVTEVVTAGHLRSGAQLRRSSPLGRLGATLHQHGDSVVLRLRSRVPAVVAAEH